MWSDFTFGMMILPWKQCKAVSWTNGTCACNIARPVKVTQQETTYSFRCGRYSDSPAVPVLQESTLNTRLFIFRGSILPAKVTLRSINLLGKYMRVCSESNNLLFTNLCAV
jgi:hypothetical protein